MPALTGQERPAAPATGAVMGTSVVMLPIAIAIVSMPDRAAGRLGLEQRVNDPDRSQDQRVLGIPQTEANKLQEFGADRLVSGYAVPVGSVVDRQDLVNDVVAAFEDLGRQCSDIIAGHP